MFLHIIFTVLSRFYINLNNALFKQKVLLVNFFKIEFAKILKKWIYRKNSDAYQKLRREKPAKFMENGKCVKINLFHILKAGFKKNWNLSKECM